MECTKNCSYCPAGMADTMACIKHIDIVKGTNEDIEDIDIEDTKSTESTHK